MSVTEDHNPSRLGRAEAEENLVYELGYLVLSSVAEDHLSKVVDSIKGIIKKSGGVEIASENPIKIDLAYTMSKTVGARKYIVNDAYIGWVKFECAPDSLDEVNGAVKNLDEILRFLLVKTSRETHFTFAEALKAKADKIKELEEAKEALETPVEPVVQ